MRTITADWLLPHKRGWWVGYASAADPKAVIRRRRPIATLMGSIRLA